MAASMPSGRSLSVPGWIAIVVVYLAIIQGLNLAFGPDEYAKFRTIEDIVGAIIIPVGASALYVAAIITWLGWWPQVLSEGDRERAPRWLLVVPVLMVLAIIAGADYGELVDRTATFLLVYLIGGLLVGFAEEAMYRGVGVETFRSNGYREVQVALWTSVVFGLSHATNIFTEGGGAISQAVITAAAGFFFYLIRRVTGTIIAAMLVHAFWDLALFSGAMGDEAYPGALLFVAVDVLLVILLLVRRKHLGFTSEPAT